MRVVVSTSRNGVVVRWAAIILAALGMFAAALWSIAGVHSKAEANQAAVETLKKEQSSMAKDISEIKTGMAVLLERTKQR